MERLIFCRDGILRRTFHAYDSVTRSRVTTQVPVLAWQSAVDPDTFLKSLGSVIKFEDGLTIAEMMENLAPWADVMTGVACMDFPAFLEEARNPMPGCEEISHMELYYSASLSAVPKFEDVEELFTKKENGFFEMNIGRPLFTGQISLEDRWDYAAVLTEEARASYGGADNVSLSFTPVSEYAHLPVRFREGSVLYDETSAPSRHAFLGTRKALTRADHPNVVRVPFGNKGKHAHQVPIVSPTPTFYAGLVRGLLWEMGFSYSPVQRDEQKQQVMNSVEEVENLESGLPVIPPEEPTIDEEFAAEMLHLSRAQEAASDLGLSVSEVKRSEAE